MATHEVHKPPTVSHGEPCASCGAPLAADQRYCLACGARRAPGGPPLAAGSAPVAGVTTATTAVTSTGETPEAARLRTNLSALGALACLLLALGIGVLIGRGGADRGTAKPAPAQVITVGAASTPPATTTTPAGSATTPATPATHKAAKSKASTAKSAKGSKATNNAVQGLDKLSPQQYQKKSQKLPKVLGTGGKAPPKDNKPAAGGGTFQNIG
jgi:hypothetical protein